MWLALLKFIPGVSSLLTWAGNTALKLYSAKLSADGAHEAKVVELASKELALNELEANLNARAKSEIRGRWYAPENLMFYMVALPYWFKAVTMDNVVGSIWEIGWSTPALKGDTALAMTMVMTFWFGLRGIEKAGNVVRAVLNR